MNAPHLPDIDLARWARCEQEALHGSDHNGRKRVAGLVAELAWKELREDESDTGVESSVVLDETTPSLSGAHIQAVDIAARVCTALDDAGVRFWEPALGRRHALSLAMKGGGTGLAHVRTGSRWDESWWLALAQHLGEWGWNDRPMRAFVVWAPRVRVHKEGPVSMTERSADSLVLLGTEWKQRVESILEGEDLPLARPGTHCARCTAQCVVRG